MTALRHLYQDFGAKTHDVSGHVNAGVSKEKLEDIRLEAFEKGYAAGWDDALKTTNEARASAAEAIGEALQNASFGFHEARAGLVKALQPVFEDIATKLLPQAATHSLGPHVVEQLTAMIRSGIEQDVYIEAHPDNLEALRDVTHDALQRPFTLKPNPRLGATQVILRVGQDEKEMDLDAVARGIGTALQAFVQQIQKEQKP